MSTNERPGVYSSIEVSGSINGSKSGKVVGLAARAAKGEIGVSARILSYAEAVSRYGADCNLSRLIRVLFLNGAYAVEAVPAAIGESAALGDYEAAFEALMGKEAVAVMLCDSAEADVHAAMRAAVLGASENNKYRIGLVEGCGSISQVSAAAESLNCERMVMVYSAGDGAADCFGETAAAVAGVLAGSSDPALPLNGAELFGLSGVSGYFSDSEVSALVAAGLTPVERVGNAVSVVRGLTTRTMTGGDADATWRELTTVLIIDDVVPAVRSALRVKFPRVKNTAQTRGAIRTQVIIELENKLRQEIIDSYGEVTAEPDAEDPTICIVSFSFAVAHGLNRINLTAHISV